MNYLIAALMLLYSSCQTAGPTKDRITLNLPSHIEECRCMMQKYAEQQSYQINWNNKEELKKQVKECKCTLKISNWDDVENPQDYIKPGTAFYAPAPGMPWDKNFETIIKIK